MEQTPDIQVKRLVVQKLREHKKEVKLEDFKEYIELFCPERKAEFKAYCLEEVELEKNGEKTGERGVRPFLTIKKEFYAKYFIDDAEKTRRQNLFADW